MSRSTAAKVTPRNLANTAKWIRNWHLALDAFNAELAEPEQERNPR